MQRDADGGKRQCILEQQIIARISDLRSLWGRQERVSEGFFLRIFVLQASRLGGRRSDASQCVGSQHTEDICMRICMYILEQKTPARHTNTTIHTRQKDPRKHRNNVMRCVCVGEESDGEITSPAALQPRGAVLRQK
jgi:hypothetical protein